MCAIKKERKKGNGFDNFGGLHYIDNKKRNNLKN